MFVRKYIFLPLLIFLIIGLFLFCYAPVIFQEGNPWPQIKGIIQLSFTNNNLVQLSSGENTYMTKSQNGLEVIKSYMKNREYDFIEQMGSGYIFKSTSGETVIITDKQYSRFYLLWNIPKIVK